MVFFGAESYNKKDEKALKKVLNFNSYLTIIRIPYVKVFA